MKRYSLLGASLFSAGIPFLCCWTPAVLMGVAGFIGISSGFEWVHPVRPYLNAISFVTLGFVHYRAYRNEKVKTPDNNKFEGCGCKENIQGSTNNKWMLWIITFLVVVMTIINYLIDY